MFRTFQTAVDEIAEELNEGAIGFGLLVASVILFHAPASTIPQWLAVIGIATGLTMMDPQ